MPDAQLTEEPTKHWSSPLLYGVSIVVQAALFLAAAAALTLFYSSFRPGDFGETLILIGLLLTAPWFLITLLPAFFGLEDSELRREILARQVLTTLVVVIFLIGLSIYLGFHQELWDQIVSMALTLGQFSKDSLHTIASYISTIIDTMTALFNEKVLPLFSG